MGLGLVPGLGLKLRRGIVFELTIGLELGLGVGSSAMGRARANAGV